MTTLIAVPVWDGRVSPVLDSAVELLVASVNEGHVVAQQWVTFDSPLMAARAAQLAGLGIHALICGAVSRPLRLMVEAGGVDVIANVCGSVDEVIEAFLHGRLQDAEFAMPGCGPSPGPHRNGRHRHRQRGRAAENPRFAGTVGDQQGG